MQGPTLHRWHRRVGISTALVVVMLSVSGLLLNHTGQMKLAEQFVVNDLLLDWYNIRPPEAPVSFQLGEIRVTRIGDRLYFQDRELEQTSDILWGLARQQQTIVLALQDKLLLLTESGEQIELLDGYDGVPAGMTGIGMNEYAELVIRAAHGDYLADLDALAWEDYEEIAAEWSKQSDMPEPLAEKLLHLYRGKGLSWERLLLDLHSGRLFGVFGVYIVDLSALLFLFLTLSGSWMWMKRKV